MGPSTRSSNSYAKTKRRFMESKVIYFLQELASALRYCHEDLRIMHRDIKPANILLDQLGTLKLADFGLSKSLDPSTDLAKTYVGTPLYMSPEQCAGQPYSFSADMWSLGVVAYELMALRSPWIVERQRDLSGPRSAHPGGCAGV